MEKYSQYRDPGTGIQPFLIPVPPIAPDLLANALLPVGYLVGGVRTALVLVLTLIYLVTIEGVLLVLTPVPFIYNMVSHAFVAVIGRLVLLLLGLWWMPSPELVTRKRVRGAPKPLAWKPRAGDIIVSNWASWIEIVWLAIRYNPTFVLPVVASTSSPTMMTEKERSPVPNTPGRRTGTGSAAISAPTRVASARVPITGFRKVSLLQMIRLTGQTPPFDDVASGQPLEQIRKNASRPLVVFPECTTSNGRGMLRFAEVFKDQTVPVKKFNVFVMAVRYDPPTTWSPTLTHSVPGLLPHVFSLARGLSPLTLSIRQLALSDSPSSQLFMVNEVVTGTAGEDQLTESCAALIAQLKVKRTGMGWEDKVSFFKFYNQKK